MPARLTLTEAEFTKQVISLARLCGWRTAHFRPAQTENGWRTPCQGDAKGFPDLVLVRDRVLFRELKVKGKLTLAQDEWMVALTRAGAAFDIWTPDDWPLIERTLA